MPLSDYVVMGAPDLTFDQFHNLMLAAKSPAFNETRNIYDALVSGGVRPSIWLAFGMVESKLGREGIVAKYNTRNMGNVRSPEDPSLGTMIQTERGVFASYATWALGARDWAKRLAGPKYAGKGLHTIRAILPIYAPSGDSNDPDAYARTVLQKVAEWTQQGTGGTMMTVAKPHVVTRPSPNKNGYGSPHEPRAITLHITEGSGASALSWLTSPASQASANYINAEDGTLYELVPPTESAWCNGDVQKPNLANPVVAAVVASGRNANTATISVENAGHTSMGKGGSLTTAQVDSLVRLCAWLCQQFHIPPDRDHIIGHYQWNSVTRPNCPGFAIWEFNTWIGRIAALVNGATPATPVGDPGFPGALQPDGRSVLNGVDYGGTLVRVEWVELGGVNAAGERYARKWEGHALADWHKVG